MFRQFLQVLFCVLANLKTLDTGRFNTQAVTRDLMVVPYVKVEDKNKDVASPALVTLEMKMFL